MSKHTYDKIVTKTSMIESFWSRLVGDDGRGVVGFVPSRLNWFFLDSSSRSKESVDIVDNRFRNSEFIFNFFFDFFKWVLYLRYILKYECVLSWLQRWYEIKDTIHTKDTMGMYSVNKWRIHVCVDVWSVEMCRCVSKSSSRVVVGSDVCVCGGFGGSQGGEITHHIWVRYNVAIYSSSWVWN